MSVAEYFGWCKYFGKRPFTLEMLNYGYGTVASAVYNVAALKQVVTAQDFSVLNTELKTREMTAEEMMEASIANDGVLRIGPD
ncbi:phage tail assembly protein T [Aggregatibacter actinomycetemcomitans]|uniref:phage tail assembly protein T n=1 Tax=Aggregatibacter actinomycetemcomitans TaxID=714 RepID=UPI002150DC82|nr:phage tail assembly protein T [Aggregatibacter actinomycetemcomitans]